MNLLAAAAHSSPILERLRQIPFEFWWKSAAAILVLVAVVLLLRRLAHVNKYFLAGGALLIATFVGFNWIYERNEPAWATPAVQQLAEFFPSKAHLADN